MFVDLCNKGIKTQCIASIIRGARRNLLGIAEIRGLNLLAIVNSVRRAHSEFDLFNSFACLFQGLGTMPDEYHIVMKPDVEHFRIRSPRPIPIGLRAKAKSEIDKMFQLNVIEPVEVLTDRCSVLTIVPKPNNCIRMCIDLTMLD